MTTLTQLVYDVLSDHKWHSAKEVFKAVKEKSGKTRGDVHVCLCNMVTRNQIKKNRISTTEVDSETHFRLPEVHGFGISEKMAIFDRHIRAARSA